MTISNAPDRYWKLDLFFHFNLKELHQHVVLLGFIKINRTASRDYMLKALHRRERGQVSYDLYSANQLLQASYDFDLHQFQHISSANKLGPIQRQRLIEALEAADQRGRSFKAFLNLPAELRTRVYEYYVAALPKTLRTPVKPPLALACKLLRRELLPVFYKLVSIKSFLVYDLMANASVCRSIEFELPMLRTCYTNGKIIETKKTQLFLLHLAREDIACIRRLKLLIHRGSKADDPEGFACHINFNHYGMSLCVQTSPERTSMWQGKGSQYLFREAMEKHIDELPITNGKKRLTLADVYKMRRLAEATLKIR